MEQVMPLPDLDGEIAGWKDGVNEIRNELNELNERLGKVALQKTSLLERAQVEHFQNQFICKKEAADRLFKELKLAAKKLKNEPENTDESKLYEHLNERVQSFQRLFNALRSEFDYFAEEN